MSKGIAPSNSDSLISGSSLSGLDSRVGKATFGHEHKGGSIFYGKSRSEGLSMEQYDCGKSGLEDNEIRETKEWEDSEPSPSLVFGEGDTKRDTSRSLSPAHTRFRRSRSPSGGDVSDDKGDCSQIGCSIIGIDNQNGVFNGNSHLRKILRKLQSKGLEDEIISRTYQIPEGINPFKGISKDLMEVGKKQGSLDLSSQQQTNLSQ